MIGIPTVLATKQDWLNAYRYVLENDSPEEKRQFRDRLTALTQARFVKTLKADAPTDSEQQTLDDFEDTLDPASPFAQSGLTEDEIDQMTEALDA